MSEFVMFQKDYSFCINSMYWILTKTASEGLFKFDIFFSQLFVNPPQTTTCLPAFLFLGMAFVTASFSHCLL